MNERIQELVPQAYELVRKNHNGYFTQELLLSCMAELVVKECARIADQNSPLSYPDHGIKIKRHFGVE